MCYNRMAQAQAVAEVDFQLVLDDMLSVSKELSKKELQMDTIRAKKARDYVFVTFFSMSLVVAAVLLVVTEHYT